MGKYNFDLDLFGDNTISWIAKSIDEASRVLEFGPANGRLTKYLTEQKKCKVDIVEIDLESGTEAAKYAETSFIGSEEGNIENYYWIQTKKKYDFIVFADVLEHLINPQNVLERCNAVIKENGKVLVSVPNAAHNSVIIELFNDEFEYNPTGILDNTHLKFYTRKSFEKMAQNAGWTIIGEKAKQIRVGENEIKNSYQDVSKKLFKELAHRENGNYYQYMFVLASCENYLSGIFERTVSLDSTSYYFSEIYTEWEGRLDYKHSISKHFDPYYGWLDVEFPLTGEKGRTLIKPINCNCILTNIRIRVDTDEGEKNVEIEKLNGLIIEECFFCIDDIPQLEIRIPQNSKRIIMQAQILDYDFDKNAYENVIRCINKIKNDKDVSEQEVNQLEEQLHEKDNKIKEICDDYEQASDRVNQLEEQLHEKDNKIKEICNNYEAEIERINGINDVYSNSIKGATYNLLRCIKKKGKKTRIVDIYADKDVINIDKSKKIVAVIPNYNYARFIRERLDSIVFQTYPVSKIIVLDDCSTDNSIEVIENYIANKKTDIPIELIKNEKNSGSVFAQWQKAFNVADEEYIWIAEADDSCNEKFLETVMRGFDDPEVVLSYCESLTMDENNKVLMGDLREWIDIFKIHKWDSDYVKDGEAEVAETMCINNTIANVSSVVFRKGDYNSILEGAKKYKLAGDWYVYMNILKLGKIAYFKESLNYHRMQSQGLTLSTSHEKEFEEIVSLQNFALENFSVSEAVKTKIYERREREKRRFGL